MDHIVFPDSGARELENLINGSKSMILRGFDEKCVPYGMVSEGDMIYFADPEAGGLIKAKGRVTFVFNSGKLTCEESFETIIRHQDRLQLPDKLFYSIAGKRYLVIIGLDPVTEIHPVPVRDALSYNEGDWIVAGDAAVVGALI